MRRWWLLLVLLYALPARAQSGDEPSGAALETLDESELEALGLDAAGPRVDTDFHFWGFADFSSSMLIHPKGAPAVAQGRYQSFYVGNLNVYVSKNLSESFRTMAEVRLTYLPNGSFKVRSDGFQQEDTSTIDYANGQSLTRWGGIILQRVYLEWTLHRLVAVRGGQFLTPVGIWNVDHGSPVYIPAQRPVSIVNGLFPERQTGLEAFGRWNANNENTLGYHLTLSNGSGPISEYKDLDRNKALGWRLYWEYFTNTYVRAGISGYFGRDTVSTPTANITATTIDLDDRINAQADLLTLAADVQIKRGGLHLQAEWISQQRRYTRAGRTTHGVIGAPTSTAASADTFSWGSYGLVAYRFEWYGLTPYALLELGRITLNNLSLPDARVRMIGPRVGVAISPIPSVVFKAELARFWFPEAPAILADSTNAFLVQIAWAF